jgi:hypothetical protein
LAYDKTRYVITQSPRYVLFALVFFGCIGGGMAVHGMATGLWWTFGALAMAIASVFAAYRMFFRRRGNKAVIGPNGILLVHHAGGLEEFSWDTVGSATYGRFGGDAKLLTDDGHTLRTVEYQFFGANHRVKEFIAAVNEWKAGPVAVARVPDQVGSVNGGRPCAAEALSSDDQNK